MSIKIEAITDDGFIVKVIFDDGHDAMFVPFTKSLQEGIEMYRLFDGNGKLVFEYLPCLKNSLGKESGNYIKLIGNDYSQQKVAAYWRTVNYFLKKEFRDKLQSTNRNLDLWYPWSIICTEDSETALRALEDNNAVTLEGVS